MEKLPAHAEQKGIDDFGRLISIYHNSTELSEKLDAVPDYMALEEHLNSPQVQEDRERYNVILIEQGKSQSERLKLLNELAIWQLKTMEQLNTDAMKKLEEK